MNMLFDFNMILARRARRRLYKRCALYFALACGFGLFIWYLIIYILEVTA